MLISSVFHSFEMVCIAPEFTLVPLTVASFVHPGMRNSKSKRTAVSDVTETEKLSLKGYSPLILIITGTPFHLVVITVGA